MAAESAAFQIQRIYTGLEEILKSTIGKFGQITSGENSYLELLKLSAIENDKRPAILDENTFSLMNELRAFRHFARHNYGSTIKSDRIEEISKINIDCLTFFEQNWKQFKNHFLDPKVNSTLKLKR